MRFLQIILQRQRADSWAIVSTLEFEENTISDLFDGQVLSKQCQNFVWGVQRRETPQSPFRRAAETFVNSEEPLGNIMDIDTSRDAVVRGWLDAQQMTGKMELANDERANKYCAIETRGFWRPYLALMDDDFAVVQLPRIAPLRISKGSKGSRISRTSDPGEKSKTIGKKITAEDLIKTPPHLRLVRTGFDYGGIGVPLRVIDGKLVRDKIPAMASSTVRDKVRRLEAQAVVPAQNQTEPISQSARFSGVQAQDVNLRMSDPQIQAPATVTREDSPSKNNDENQQQLRHKKSFYNTPIYANQQTPYADYDYGDLSPSPEVYGTNPRPFEIPNLDLESTGLKPAYTHTYSARKSEASSRSNYSQLSNAGKSATTLNGKNDIGVAQWFGIPDNPYTDQDTHSETLDEATQRILKMQKEASKSLEIIYDGRDEKLERVRARYRKNRQPKVKTRRGSPTRKDMQTSAPTPELDSSAKDSTPGQPAMHVSLLTRELDVNASESTLVHADTHPFSFGGASTPMDMEVASPLLTQLSVIQCKANVVFELANKLMKTNSLKQKMPNYKAMKKALPNDIKEVQKLINDLLMEKSGEHTPFKGLDINRVKRAIDIMMDTIITMGRQVDRLGRSVRGTNRFGDVNSEIGQALQLACTYLGYLVEYLERHVYPEKCGKPRIGKAWNAVQALQTAFEEWSFSQEKKSRKSI
ncbi:hypothetical protein B0J14DRAFT_566133 [Halenospora varia]|nr:hypothetical protein B0J14DRAFT_566133 [Halenospora varia]